MFQLSASEAIGRNVKSLMPKEHAVRHDDYLYNYLSTGVKKMIGMGRQLNGVKTDGTVFPLNLAVSEVIDEGLHLFTAIVRDLTEQVAHEARIQAEEARQRAEMDKLMSNLAIAREKSADLLGSMLPSNVAERIMSGEIVKPEQYTACTIFFSNIVGFNEIAAEAKSHDIVNLLNDLYTYFDAVVDNHGIQFLLTPPRRLQGRNSRISLLGRFRNPPAQRRPPRFRNCRHGPIPPLRDPLYLHSPSSPRSKAPTANRNAHRRSRRRSRRDENAKILLVRRYGECSESNGECG
jgi:PAS domain S-box-containing protein